MEPLQDPSPVRLLVCVLLDFSLGVEPVDKDVVKQKPRNVKEPMITRSVIINVLLSAFIIIAGTLWVFKREVTGALSHE